MILNLKDKIIIFLVALITAGVLGFIIYNQHKLDTQQTAQAVAAQQLADNVSRALSIVVTKADLTAFAQQNDANYQVVQDNLKTLNATLTAISQVTANSSAQNNSNVS